MTPLFDLLLISPEQDLKDEIEVLVELFNLGLTTYHLRKPEWPAEKTQQWISLLPKEFYSRVVLHNHFELAKKFELKGIHLSEKNKPEAGYLSKYKITSASFHTLEDLRANAFPYEYVFLSPIFNSISKAEYKSNFDLGLLAGVLNAIKLQNTSAPKIFGLGGINSQNILALKSAGFSGAALLGSVWQSENPVKAFSEIRAIIQGN